eukprot:CAMPEP_0170451264 /NCGR_PEP_ID=MMETSP0123-20130129/572_1 /TAXON_ID=182087 /ORGANISM="Favella ehrenbergii, Strain Fehren 1" /LENGTH=147 /DNA_ID=CAMNT_0010712915 /DNA_START=2118 /DNA_END=2561 /DNA_ORIENTATION=+
MDDVAIFVREGGNSDSDERQRLIFVAKVGQLGQPTLHLLRDPIAEGVRSRSVPLSTSLLLLYQEVFRLLVKPIFIKARLDVKLDRVVSGSDRLDIPLNVVKLLVLADEVEIVQAEKSDENGEAGDYQSLELALINFFLGQHASNLDE